MCFSRTNWASCVPIELSNVEMYHVKSWQLRRSFRSVWSTTQPIRKDPVKRCLRFEKYTGLDPDHTYTSLSVDQMIQFVRLVGLEISLTPDELVEELLLRARSVSSLGFPGESGHLPFLRVIGSAVDDCVASQGICCQQFLVLRQRLRVKIFVLTIGVQQSTIAG